VISILLTHSFLAAEAVSNSSNGALVLLAALGSFLIAVSTAAGVWWSAKQKRAETVIDKHRLSTEEFEAVSEALGSLSDRWEGQARAAWEEIEKLKKAHEEDRKKIFELERSLAEEKFKSARLEARLERLIKEKNQEHP
jgi:hypothetical protein